MFKIVYLAFEIYMGYGYAFMLNGLSPQLMRNGHLGPCTHSVSGLLTYTYPATHVQ